MPFRNYWQDRGTDDRSNEPSHPSPGRHRHWIRRRKVWSPGFSRQSVTFVQRVEMVASIDNSRTWPAEAGTPNPTAIR